MKVVALFALLSGGIALAARGESLNAYEELYSNDSVETQDLRIVLEPVDEDVRFSISLSDKETGAELSHGFDGQGANDPSPFLLRERIYCDTSVILLTIEYPFRHALPQPSLVLETYAFRREDLAFIDVAYGPLTEIALQDETEDTDLSSEMLPPVGVRCKAGQTDRPLEFFRREPS